MRRLALAIAAAILLFPAHAQQAAEISEADRERISAAIASPTRPLEQRLRDERRTPEVILSPLRVQPGDVVLDIASGGGYLARMIAELVGQTGRVDIHNTPGWIAQFPSMDPDRMARAIDRQNVSFLTTPWNELDAPPETYDAIVMGQVYHDILLEGGDFEAMNRRLFGMLKPGGMLVIEDHDADPDMPPGEQVVLHRIDQHTVKRQMERVGFETIDVVALPSQHDDFRFNVFRPGIRGRTTRYVLGFRKPG